MNDFPEDTADTKHNKGMFLDPDDIELNQFFAVHSAKLNPEYANDFFGLPLKVKALNLPFIAASIAQVPDRVIPVDVRFFNLMKLSSEYVEAFKVSPPKNPIELLFGQQQ